MDTLTNNGFFGDFGGRYIPETLIPACEELELAFKKSWADDGFKAELNRLLADFAGRPTPITECRNLSGELGCELILKREDLNHTGSHKINNVLAQALLALRMGKRRLIAETGAGQHGVATATAAAVFGMECVVYMGEVDIHRQESNVFRMKLLGAEVIPVKSGSKTLKDAINEALRDWVANAENTHYCVGSVVGPHPYPLMVREFQSVIGEEAARQCTQKFGRLPDTIVACVGGGSNSIGIFSRFLDEEVDLIGVEPEGGAALGCGESGILHGSMTNLLQDSAGQILEAKSISAGLDYPAVGPEHAYLAKTGRVKYFHTGDDEVIAAFQLMARTEGIIPALEPAHALAWICKNKKKLAGRLVLMNLSGHGDKDAAQMMNKTGNSI